MISNSRFKTTMPDNVRYADGCIHFIKSIRDIVLNKGQVEAVITQIEHLLLQRGMATNRQHRRNLREKAKPREETEPDCPKFGDGMVLRIVRKGKNAGNIFWGMYSDSCLSVHCRSTLNDVKIT